MNPDASPLFERLRDEQAVLLAQLDRLAHAPTRTVLAVELESLFRTLTAHFAAEAGPGGLLAPAREAGPEETRRVRRHLAEHAGIRRALQDELDELTAESDGVWAEHGRAVDAIVRRIRAHEAASAELLDDLALVSS